MKAKMFVTAPDEVSLTATFMMRLRAWKEIAQHMKEAPHYRLVGEFKSTINNMFTLTGETVPALSDED